MIEADFENLLAFLLPLRFSLTSKTRPNRVNIFYLIFNNEFTLKNNNCLFIGFHFCRQSHDCFVIISFYKVLKVPVTWIFFHNCMFYTWYKWVQCIVRPSLCMRGMSCKARRCARMRCDLRFQLSAKAREHPGHWNGSSPVCVRACRACNTKFGSFLLHPLTRPFFAKKKEAMDEEMAEGKIKNI